MAKVFRSEWVILGRVIGTATGWEYVPLGPFQANTFVMQLYDFEPADGVRLPADGCITFDFEKGLAETFDDAGRLKQSFDIISSLHDAKQKDVALDR
jgi:hypothetical protein